MKFIHSIILFGTLVFLATGCSLKPEDQTKIRISFPKLETITPWIASGPNTGLIGLPSPSTLDEFDCFGVNVTGPDIQSNSFTSSCSNSEGLDPGIIGGLAPIQGGSVDVMVPRGIRRTFQLFVVQSQKKIGCPAVSDVWSHYLGSSEIGIPMEVGRTTADILADAEVTIKAVWDPTNPKPMFCSSKEGVPVQLSLLGESEPRVSECVGYSVELQDQEETPADAPWDVKVTLGLQGGGTLYQDDACSRPLDISSQITLFSGSSSERFYFRKEDSKSTTITASAIGLKSAQSVITPQKTELGFIVDPPASAIMASILSPSVEVGIYDATGELILNSSSSTVVTLNLYSDSECTNVISGGLMGNTANPLNGVASFSQLMVYSTGIFYIGASEVTSISACSKQAILVMPNYFPNPFPTMIPLPIPTYTPTPYPIPSPSPSPTFAPFLSFAVLPSNSGQSSGIPLNGLLEIHAYDSTGALYSGNLKVVLDVYEDPNCTVQAGLNDLSISNVKASQNPVETTNGVASFSDVIIRNPGVIYFGAKANGMGSACSPSSILIQQGPAVQLEILGSQVYQIQFTGASSCQEYRVRALDSTHTPIAVTNSLPISLTQSGSGMFFANSDCSLPLSTLSLSASSIETSFWFKDYSSVPQKVNLNASASGMVSASYSVVETLGGGATGSYSYPSYIQLSRDRFSVPAGSCEGPFTLSIINSQGSKYMPSSTDIPITIQLSSDPSVKFYSSCSGDEMNSVAIDFLTLGEAKFYVRTQFPGLFEIEAQDSSGKLREMKDVIVSTSNQSPFRLIFAGGEKDGTAYAQECSMFGLVAIDSYGYPAHFSNDVVFNLTSTASSGTVQFYEDESCLVPSNQLTFKQGLGVALLKYKATASGKIQIQAQNSIYGTSALGMNVLPSAVRQFSIQGPKSGINVNECREFQVVPVDAMGNVISLTHAMVAKLNYYSSTSISGANSGGFYPDSTCANSLTGNQLTLPTGSSGVSVWFKAGVAGVFTLIAEDFEVLTSKYEISVGANGVDHVQIQGPAYGLENTCYGPFQLTAMDSNGFSVSILSTTSFNLTGSTFFSTDQCNGSSISSVHIQAGQQKSSLFWILDSVGRKYLAANGATNISSQFFSTVIGTSLGDLTYKDPVAQSKNLLAFYPSSLVGEVVGSIRSDRGDSKSNEFHFEVRNGFWVWSFLFQFEL